MQKLKANIEVLYPDFTVEDILGKFNRWLKMKTH